MLYFTIAHVANTAYSCVYRKYLGYSDLVGGLGRAWDKYNAILIGSELFLLLLRSENIVKACYYNPNRLIWSRFIKTACAFTICSRAFELIQNIIFKIAPNLVVESMLKGSISFNIYCCNSVHEYFEAFENMTTQGFQYGFIDFVSDRKIFLNPNIAPPILSIWKHSNQP